MDKPKIALPDSVVKRVRDILLDDEDLLLVTQPARWRVMRDTLLLLPLSIVGCIGTAYLLLLLLRAGGTGNTANDNFRLFLILILSIFGVLCLILLTAPVWAYRNAHRHIYAITGKRAIIIEPLPYYRESVRSYASHDMTQLRIKKSGHGAGDLYFASRHFGSTLIQIGFLGIHEAESVRKLMLETFEFDEHDFWKA